LKPLSYARGAPPPFSRDAQSSERSAGSTPRKTLTPYFGLLLTLATFASPAFAVEERLPVFETRSANGKTPTGELLKLGDNWHVHLGGANPTDIPEGELVVLRRVGRSLPDRPAGLHLVFTNGDCLPVRGVQLDGERVVYQLNDKNRTELKAPLSALSVLWRSPSSDLAERDKLRRRWAAEKRPRDVVRLRNGDTVEGILTGFDDSVVQVEVDKKKVRLDLENVAAVALSTELASVPKPKGAFGRVVLADGARLSLSKAVCDDGKTLSATTLYNARVQIPLSELVALYVYQGNAVYLSDLKPSKFDWKPFGNLDWPPVADGSVSGRDLRLAGNTYDKGMGLHADTRLSYDLGGNYRWFEALVGLEELDDGKTGSARVKVLVDAKPRPLDAELLSDKSKPLPIRLDVKDAKELTLIVEFGKRGDVLARVNWIDARLLR
jgi:hypothetical protein